MVTATELGWAGLALLALLFLAQYSDARRMTRGPATIAMTIKEMTLAIQAWITDFLTLTRTTLVAFGLTGSVFFIFPHLIGIDPFAWLGSLTFLVAIAKWFGIGQFSAWEIGALIAAIFVALWLIARAMPKRWTGTSKARSRY